MIGINKFFLVLFSFIFLIGFSFAAEIHVSECIDFDSSYNDDEIILDSSISSYQGDGSCFDATGLGITNITINCNDNQIIPPIGSASKFLNLDVPATSITLKNCDFNWYSYTPTSYLFYIYSDLDNLLVLDSEIYAVQGDIIRTGLHPSLYESALDVNFQGTQINMSNTSKFAVITRGFSNYLKFNNLNIDSTSNQALITFNNTDVVSSLSVIGSDINLSNSYFIYDVSSTDVVYVYYFTDVNYFGNDAFIAASAIDKNIIGMFFSNFDANYIYFDSVNLIPSGTYLKLLSGTDINYIEFSNDSDIHSNAGVSSAKLLEIWGVNDSYLNINFNNASIDMYGTDLIKLVDETNISRFDIYNLSSTIRRGSLIYLAALSGLNLNLIDSDITLSDYSATNRAIIKLWSNHDLLNTNLDFNFYNSLFYLPSTAGFLFSNYDSNFQSIAISNLTLSADTNLLDINGTVIPELTISDSNINVDRIANLLNNANVAGSLYNNIIYYDGISNLVDGAGTFNVDFNTTYNSDNNAKRSLWLIDDSSSTGGNLWLDLAGNNLCDEDILNPFGICDSNYTSADGYIDYLPLVAYTREIDAEVQSIIYNYGDLIYGETAIVNAQVKNMGDFNIETSDMNVIIYYSNVDSNTGTTIDTLSPIDVIELNITQGIFAYWDINTLDFNYLCARIESEYDINTENDYYCEYVDTVYYRDLNISGYNFSLAPRDINFGYGLVGSVFVDVNIFNNGNYDSNDFNVYIYFISHSNHNNYDVLTYSNNDLAGLSLLELSNENLYWEPTIPGRIDINIVISNSESDYNTEDNYLFFDDYYKVVGYDLSTTIGDINDVNVGHDINILCNVQNLGDYNLPSQSHYLYLKLNGIRVDFVDLDESQDLNMGDDYNHIFTYAPNYSGDLNFACDVLISASIGTDFNESNNFSSVLKTVGKDTNVDLSVNDIRVNSTVAGTTSIVYCDINNLNSDENATNDYNVILDINGTIYYELVDANILTESQNIVSFSWAPTAGTYSLSCEVDYNVFNYTGYDANILNNDYNETITITSANSVEMVVAEVEEDLVLQLIKLKH